VKTEESSSTVKKLHRERLPFGGQSEILTETGSESTMQNTYPLSEGFTFRFTCQGCGNQHKTDVPKHDAPFMWRCPEEGCGWSVQIQTDVSGVSVGYQAPLPQKPRLELVR